jgi:hypothetical protein
MKKIFVAFFITLFLVCGGLGYGVAREAKALAAHNPEVLMSASQVNLILVRVDDLSQANPTLVSVWGVFINQAVSSTMILKQIYPDLTSLTSKQLRDNFSLDSKKQLSNQFLGVIHNMDLPVSGSVLVDNNRLGEWATAVLHQSLLINPVGSTDPNNIGIVQRADQDLFTDICTTVNDQSGPGLSVPTASSRVAAISDTSNSSDYLRKWMGLVTSLHFASCETLAGP